VAGVAGLGSRERSVCGIAGIYVPPGGPPVDPGLIERMASRLVHRGPDDAGVHVEPGVGLGFRRLSIIDLAGGHQPIFNEDGSVAAVFNGEIYNFQELRRELEPRGHRFRTRADSEVLVHGWEAWGRDLVSRLRGMFAFAIWDRGQRVLFLARDRLGIKPLYYSRLPDGRWAFGSELKALLAEPSLPRDLDPCAIEEYLSLGYVPDPRSILRAARKLPPGHTLTLGSAAEPRPVAYWDVRFPANGRPRDGRDLEEELRARLDDSVRSHLVADVPLGAFLSGGIDSSAVVASMAASADGPIRTCSIAFGEEAFDESRYARMVSGWFRTEHREQRADAGSFRFLDRLVEAYDEPFSDNSALPTYLLCGLARGAVKVALSGDGGDETLAGYTRYPRFLSAAALQRVLPRAVRAPVLGAAAWLAGGGAGGASRRASLRALAGDLAETYEKLVGVSSAAERRRLYTASFRSALQGYEAVDLLRRHYAQAPAEEPLARIQYVDIKTYLPGEILTKVDRASMAHSLEVRVPLLDHPWVEWAATLPPEAKIRRGSGKEILRRALRSRLPPEVLDRPKKGFSVPVAEWLRGPLRQQLQARLLGPGLADAGVLEPREVSRLVGEHLRGRRSHAGLLWALLMFEAAWARLRSL
jgi:asparagine synthase (glutamine-hydrolysing)